MALSAADRREVLSELASIAKSVDNFGDFRLALIEESKPPKAEAKDDGKK